MKRILTSVFACAFAMSATSALAQSKPPLKLGGILDMSSLYADITGSGSAITGTATLVDGGASITRT